MSPIPRKITLTNVVDEEEILHPSAPIAHSPASSRAASGFIEKARARLSKIRLPFSIRSFFAFSRVYRWWILSMLFVIAGWAVIRADSNDIDPNKEKLSALETRVVRLEKELTLARQLAREPSINLSGDAPSTTAALAAPASAVEAEISDDKEVISKRRFLPDGSERDDPFYGEKGSSLLIMVFSDFQCRMCRKISARCFSGFKI